MKPVVIVGGGISGLTLAFALDKKGVPVQVLEAGEQPGGTMRSSNEQGYRYEHGPNTVLDKEPKLLQLIEEVGLSEHLVKASSAARTRLIVLNGKLRAVPMGPQLLTSDLLSLKARARLLAEVAVPQPSGEDETIAQFASRHVGEEPTRTLVDPMVTGIYAGDIDRLSLKACFPNLARMEKEHRSLVFAAISAFRHAKEKGTRPPMGAGMVNFKDGMNELPAAIARKLGPKYRGGAKVRTLAQSGDGFTVSLEGGEQLEASAVVLASPAYASADIVEALKPEAAEVMRQIRYSAVATVHLGYRRSAIRGDVNAFGFVVPSRERRELMGCLYISALFPDRSPPDTFLFTSMVGGAHRPELATLPEAELCAMVDRELKELIGISEAPLFRRSVFWQRAIPQYEVGHVARVARVEALLQPFGKLFLAGNAWSDIGVADSVKKGFAMAEALAAKVQA